MRAWPILLGLLLGIVALRLGLENGDGVDGAWLLATRYTGRTSLILFLPVYCASAWARLQPGLVSLMVLRERRWWGLGFFACHLVHLYALVRLMTEAGGHRPLPLVVVGVAGYAMLALMAVTSSDRAARLLGANWGRLHRLGIHWLWFVFFATYAAQLGRISAPIGMALLLAALALRVAARRRPPQPTQSA